MGSAISAIRKQLTDDSEDKKAVDDALTGMKANADKSIQLFYSQIEAGTDSKLIPIDKIVGKFEFVQCKVSTNPATVQAQIKTLIADLAGGNWSNAIADGATSIIGDMLGNTSGGIEERTSYCISMDPLGGVYRLDQYYLSYSYVSKALVDKMQNFVACCVVKSSIDMKSLDDDTLRIIVNDSFPGITNARRADLYAAVAGALLPVPPTEKASAATAALAKLWDESFKKPVALSQLPSRGMAMVVKYLAPTLQTAAVGLFTERIVTKIIAARYSAKSSYDPDKKVITFQVEPAKDSGGITLVTGNFSCANAEKLVKATVEQDEEHADVTYQSSACKMDTRGVERDEPEFHAEF